MVIGHDWENVIGFLYFQGVRNEIADLSNYFQGKGARHNNFTFLGAETLVWQGARTAHTPRYEKDEQTSPDGMDRRPKRQSYFGASPKHLQTY